MVAQGALGFKYEEEKTSSGTTALGGLPVYLDLAFVMDLCGSIERRVKVRTNGQGWTDSQMIMSLILLNLAGGDCVDDLRILENDDGLCRVLRRVETQFLPRQQRRTVVRRWRKERRRAVPSPSSSRRYLEEFHDEEEEERRKGGAAAFIPAPNEHLLGLYGLTGDLLSFVQRRSPEPVATVDMDATLVETHKEEALYSYKKFKAYQPLSTYWAEQELVIHSQFRDGNVPAGFRQLEVFESSLKLLPSGVEKVHLRTDTAGYEWDLLKYCEEGKNDRFGRIEFAVGVDVSPDFKKAVSDIPEADWKPLVRTVGEHDKEPRQEWAEVCYVPSEVIRGKKGTTYRYLAIRENLSQQGELPGLYEPPKDGVSGAQQEFPFPTMEFADQGCFKVSGVVTNRNLPGEQLIWWHRQRCGKSEQVHDVMKNELAGGKLPSHLFGANAAWWGIMILALNLNVVMKRLVLGEGWASKRLKALRFALINLPAQVIERSRTLWVRVKAGHPSLETILDARTTIVSLANAPPG